MAEDTVNHAAELARLPDRPCVTKELRIHGYHWAAEQYGGLALYGSDAPAIQELSHKEPDLARALGERLPLIAGQVAWAARAEMARTVEDVLARRCRALFLNADEAVRMAPAVAALLARELGQDDAWQRDQVAAFESVARGYRLSA
jgi:glycerol-3-phosphate dehydrogenase